MNQYIIDYYFTINKSKINKIKYRFQIFFLKKYSCDMYYRIKNNRSQKNYNFLHIKFKISKKK